jgi:hypothetical protein
MRSMGIYEKIKGFIVNPIETFRDVREESFGTALKYFIVLLVFYSVVNAIVLTIMLDSLWGRLMTSSFKVLPMYGTIFDTGPEVSIVIIIFIFLFIMGFIGVFISAAIIHIGVLIFGGKKGYKQTVKALIYGSTPSYLLAWLPVGGLFSGIWAFILEIMGVREMQEFSTARAFAAFLLPIIIVGLIIFVVATAAVFIYISAVID